jgi:hypothetical protein
MKPEDIETALQAAKYHEDAAFQFASPAGLTKEKLAAVVFHLRAYYWELWSAWDYLLQIANSHTVNLRLRDVNTKVIDRIARGHPDYEFLPCLSQTRGSPQLVRIRRLRHSAHRWVLDPYQVEHTDHGVSVICLQMKDSFEPVQINIDRNDLSFMQQVVSNLRSAGFFAQNLQA